MNSFDFYAHSHCGRESIEKRKKTYYRKLLISQNKANARNTLLFSSVAQGQGSEKLLDC